MKNLKDKILEVLVHQHATKNTPYIKETIVNDEFIEYFLDNFNKTKTACYITESKGLTIETVVMLGFDKDNNYNIDNIINKYSLDYNAKDLFNNINIKIHPINAYNEGNVFVNMFIDEINKLIKFKHIEKTHLVFNIGVKNKIYTIEGYKWLQNLKTAKTKVYILL